MRFAFDEDPLLLQGALREFLRGECPPELLRSLWESETGRSPTLWKQLSELGSHQSIELELVLKRGPFAGEAMSECRRLLGGELSVEIRGQLPLVVAEPRRFYVISFVVILHGISP